jgi:RNA polymerase sigma-70 factor (ECF subfamily)
VTEVGADEEARLGAVYAAHRADLRRYLARLVDDDALAEDLTQDAGTRLLLAARAGPIREPRAWLFHAGANLARDALRRRAIRFAAADALAQAHDAIAPEPDHLASIEQDLGALRRAIETLPPRARTVLLMSRVEGLQHKEIGRSLGIAAKTVENHLARAVGLLAQALGTRRGGNA